MVILRTERLCMDEHVTVPFDTMLDKLLQTSLRFLTLFADVRTDLPDVV